MRELTVNELSAISGGLELGTGAGGIFSVRNIAQAGRLVSGLGAVSLAWELGWRVGTGIYNSSTFQRLSTP
jgi:bacteriocin-like protein